MAVAHEHVAHHVAASSSWWVWHRRRAGNLNDRAVAWRVSFAPSAGFRTFEPSSGAS